MIWHSFDIGRLSSEVAVLIRACLTTLFLSGKVSITRPILHCPRGLVSSHTSTTSPSLKLGRFVVHFWRDWRVCKYSRDHLDQNWSAKYCTCFQRCLEYTSELENTPGDKLGDAPTCNKWFGVRGALSSGSMMIGVSGREFKMHSTSVNNVSSVSSVTVCCCNNMHKIFRVERIKRSQIPPKWLAVGGLNFQRMFF